jgi:tetratricopeptide (TPR) repeat protein
MNAEDLTEKEHKAYLLVQQNKYADAIELLKQIASACPNWEHGGVHYKLGECYEELRQFQPAKDSYLEALKYEPWNPYYLGAYASFLYLYGDPADALNAYFDLIKAEGCTTSYVDSCMQALRVLAERIGMSEAALRDELSKLDRSRS